MAEFQDSVDIIGLSFKFSKSREHIFNNLNLTFPINGITTIIGKSGIGKSVLLSLLTGIYSKSDKNLIERFSANRFRISGRRPAELGRGPELISIMLQKSVLLENLTVRDNVLLPLTICLPEQFQLRDTERRPRNATTKLNKSAMESIALGSAPRIPPLNEELDYRCNYLLDQLELIACQGQRPCELSGGMETRVALARALIAKPRYLFLDEPFTGLDIDTRCKIYRLLRRERLEAGCCTILNTHDLTEAIIISDRIVVLYREDEELKHDIREYRQPDSDKILNLGFNEMVRSAQNELPILVDRLKMLWSGTND